MTKMMMTVVLDDDWEQQVHTM